MLLATLRANLAATIFGGLAAVFAVIAVVQTVRLSGFLWIKGATDKLETCEVNRKELKAELDRISTEKNEQQIVTVEKLKVVEKIRHVAEKQAERIENAPVEPGACKTPDAIMGADL